MLAPPAIYNSLVRYAVPGMTDYICKNLGLISRLSVQVNIGARDNFTCDLSFYRTRHYTVRLFENFQLPQQSGTTWSMQVSYCLWGSAVTGISMGCPLKLTETLLRTDSL
jgi:hypothetical protein